MIRAIGLSIRSSGFNTRLGRPDVKRSESILTKKYILSVKTNHNRYYSVEIYLLKIIL